MVGRASSSFDAAHYCDSEKCYDRLNKIDRLKTSLRMRVPWRPYGKLLEGLAWDIIADRVEQLEQEADNRKKAREIKKALQAKVKGHIAKVIHVGRVKKTDGKRAKIVKSCK